MMSLTENLNPSKHTPWYENEQNESEILQCRLLDGSFLSFIVNSMAKTGRHLENKNCFVFVKINNHERLI